MSGMVQYAPELDKQNFFCLSVIQMASTGIPALVAVGYFITQQWGPGIAIPSIFIGNLILWLIGISVISIAGKKHINGIQNIGHFLGPFGSWLVSIILAITFLDWFVLQIDATTHSLKEVLPLTFLGQKGGLIRLGVAIGLVSSLFAIGGIRFLKWASLVTLPCIFIYTGYVFFQTDHSLESVSWGLSFPPVLLTILSWLAGTLNLPTFFRHSISIAHSYLALTILTLFFALFQCLGAFMRFDVESYGLLLQFNQVHSGFEIFVFSMFIILTCLCNNLLNIYFASACYETFSPRFYGTKGHAIVGLLGTAAYAFIQISEAFQFILDLFNCYLLNLGIVLLIGFLIHAMMKYKSKPLEKWTNCIAWIVGCIAGTIAKWSNPEDSLEFLLVGASASTLFFLATIFLEETGGAIRTLYLQRARK